jgi:hypothetical protein
MHDVDNLLIEFFCGCASALGSKSLEYVCLKLTANQSESESALDASGDECLC